MPPSTSVHTITTAITTTTSPYQSHHGSTTTLQTLDTAEQASTRSGRLAALARLRIPSGSPRQKQMASPLDMARKEFTMSMCSDATTCERLPVSASELTLSPSMASLHSNMSKEEPRSLARSLVQRSSKMFLRRKASKASMVSSLNSEHAHGDESRRTSIESSHRPTSRHSSRSGMSRSKRQIEEESNLDSLPKLRISQPFNFQHVAHTAPVQAISALRQVSPTALEVEFSALQASQTPSSQLKHLDDDMLRPATSDGLRRSASGSFASSTTASERPVLARSPRSVESFKRQSKSFSQPFTQGPTPPPRKSSRRRRPPHLLNLSRLEPSIVESPTIPEFDAGPARPRTAPSPKSPLRIATSAANTPLGITGIACAVTTPDNTACMLGPDVLTPLEDVPEEEDLFMAEFVGKEAKKSSSSAAEEVPSTRMLRSGSDPVLPESAGVSEEIPLAAAVRASHRISNNPLGSPNWDEDIDYCYDHALEAESQPVSPDVGSPISEVDELIYMKTHRRHGSRSSGTSIEGLQPLPLRQSSLRSQLQTRTLKVPTMLDAPLDSAGNVMFTLSPSMLVPREYAEPPSPVPYEAYHSRQSSTKSSGSSPMAIFTPSISDLSRAYSSPRSSVTFSNTSKRSSAATNEPSNNQSAISIPDLVSSAGAHDARRSFGAQSARSSMRSQKNRSFEVSEAEATTPTAAATEAQQAVAGEKEQQPQQRKDAEVVAAPSKIPVVSKKPEEDRVSALPAPAAQQPLRARAKSESASRALAQNVSVAKSTGHGRSASSAIASGIPIMPKKATYSLFPPLDRIGAASAAARV